LDERRCDVAIAPHELARRLRRAGEPSLVFAGADRAHPAEGWRTAALIAIRPGARVLAAGPAAAEQGFAALASELAARRTRGGSPYTGLAAVVSFEAGCHALLGGRAAAGSRSDSAPAIAVWQVDRSLRFTPDGAVLSVAGGPAAADAVAAELAALVRPGAAPPAPARAVARPTTSLPRERYLRAVERLLAHIRRGDIYQANLCQRFTVPVAGDPFAWHGEQLASNPAPRGVWAELPGVALASASPETFLRVEPGGAVETWPIKGTRPRGCDPAIDASNAAELLASPKDRAELLMIVDLERNDLGRLCRVGSIAVPQLAALRSYPAVHHLVAQVTGTLAAPLDVVALLRATFPGGSISGAPKRRALELLGTVEPAPRGWFTGSLFWFGDDGSVDSSILIRSPVFAGGQVSIGAGGGIVADSDPEAEWCESNHKARAAARLLGFDPDEAS
jgi:para-aminobenzoate synthetase component 1